MARLPCDRTWDSASHLEAHENCRSWYLLAHICDRLPLPCPYCLQNEVFGV
jgi:hypothetical protein